MEFKVDSNEGILCCGLFNWPWFGLLLGKYFERLFKSLDALYRIILDYKNMSDSSLSVSDMDKLKKCNNSSITQPNYGLA